MPITVANLTFFTAASPQPFLKKFGTFDGGLIPGGGFGFLFKFFSFKFRYVYGRRWSDDGMPKVKGLSVM